MVWTHDQTTFLPAAQCLALNAVLARLSGSVGSRFQLGNGEIAVNRSGYVHHGAALAAAPLDGRWTQRW